MFLFVLLLFIHYTLKQKIKTLLFYTQNKHEARWVALSLSTVRAGINRFLSIRDVAASAHTPNL